MKQSPQNDDQTELEIMEDNVCLESEPGSSTSINTRTVRRVTFAQNNSDSDPVTGYLEPANPWASIKSLSNVSELSELYRKSCEKHKTEPIETVLSHLESLDFTSIERSPILDLKNQQLTPESCEALEEIFKRVQYRVIDLTSCDLDDVSATALFDMIEYYEAATELDISENRNITNRGWMSCISMVKRSHALQVIAVRATPLAESNAQNLGKAMLGSSLHTLKLEHCGLTGRPIGSLCSALKRNTVLKELWLAYNDLTCYDAYSIGLLLKSNLYIQFLDVSNNYIQDQGVNEIVEALIDQSNQISNSLESKKPISLASELNSLNNRRSGTPIPDKNEISLDLSDIIVTNKNENEPDKNITTTADSVRSKLDVLLNLSTDNIVDNSNNINIVQNNQNTVSNQNNNNEILEIEKLVTVVEEDDKDVEDDSLKDEIEENSLIIEDNLNDVTLKIIEEKDILNKDTIENTVLNFSSCDNNLEETNLSSNNLNINNNLIEFTNVDYTLNVLKEIDVLEINMEEEEVVVAVEQNEDVSTKMEESSTQTDSNILLVDINENRAENDMDTDKDEILHSDNDENVLSDQNSLLNEDVLKNQETKVLKNNENCFFLDSSIPEINLSKILEEIKPPNMTPPPLNDTPPSETIQIDCDLIKENKTVDENDKVKENLVPDTEKFSFDNKSIATLLEQPFDEQILTPVSEESQSPFISTPPIIIKTCDSVIKSNENFSNESHLPERSFSSDSLNSDTSMDSNDSKSSIRLAEAKFSKNGTLERQTEKINLTTDQTSVNAPSGLQVLVLWNNHLTRHSSKPFSDLIAKNSSLEILNIGRNNLGNDFLTNVKTSLRSNTTLTNLGLQGAHLSCTAVKSLADILEFGGNTSLQRIDVRDNNIQAPGLISLDESMKSNKSVTRIDLDDFPRKILDTIHDSTEEYTRLVSSVRLQCNRNEFPTTTENEPIRTNNTKKVRAAYKNSRKISLTCQSVRPTPTQQPLSSPDSINTIKKERHLLDPNRKPAGRLRSPLPSPIPSPISSPIPSPSRNRFQVSRVTEGSVSPVTPTSSTSSSPTNNSFSPNSRFRVTTVELKPPKPPVIVVVNTKIDTNVIKSEIILPVGNLIKTETQHISFKPAELLSSSFDSPDLEVKRYMDDSCSSLSSMDSLDRTQFNTSLSSTDSSDIHSHLDVPMISLSSTVLNDSLNASTSSQDSLDSSSFLKISANDDTLTNNQCIQNDGSKENVPEKSQRIRKTSWILGPMSINNNTKISEEPSHPATLDKLLSLFSRSSDYQKKEPPPPTTVNNPPVRKESPMGGLFSWMSGKKNSADEGDLIVKPDTSPTTTQLPHSSPSSSSHKRKSSVLQQHLSDNTLSILDQQIVVENLSNELKQEMKENISPEHTITASSLVDIEQITRVKFEVGGEDDEDESVFDDNTTSTIVGDSSTQQDSINQRKCDGNLGQIARDSMSILKGGSNDSQESMRSFELDSPIMETTNLTED